jgi:iron(III) transport system substrate-binding protein
VVDNPRSRPAAEDFQNFLLEPQLQAELAADYYQIPAMQIPDTAKPKWLADVEIREMPIDWAVMGEKQMEWMDYWAQNIKGKGGR